MARLLRVGIAMAPVVLAVVATYVAAALLPEPNGPAATAMWFGSLLVLSVVVMAAVERLARLLLPLTLLLRLTLVFPDQAPNRFALALRTSSTKELERTVAEVKERGLGSSEAEAAENLLVLVAALSDHDRMTRGHSERVRAYSELIGEELQLSEADRSRLRWAGLLHDVGKLYVPEEILNKPGRLTEAEFDIIKKHPEWGAELVAPLADWLGPWADAVGQHHERWDGKGYPNGLAGAEIALAARIVSVADVFDVITSVRSYKGATSATEARIEISKCAGTQFDPAVVRAFLNVGIGRVRRTMWPLTFLAQIPQLVGVLTAPVAAPALSATLAAAAVTTGAVASPAIDATLRREEPAALALVIEDRFDGLLDLGSKEILVTATSTTLSPVVDGADIDCSNRSDDVPSAHNAHRSSHVDNDPTDDNDPSDHDNSTDHHTTVDDQHPTVDDAAGTGDDHHSAVRRTVGRPRRWGADNGLAVATAGEQRTGMCRGRSPARSRLRSRRCRPERARSLEGRPARGEPDRSEPQRRRSQQGQARPRRSGRSQPRRGQPREGRPEIGRLVWLHRYAQRVEEGEVRQDHLPERGRAEPGVLVVGQRVFLERFT